MPFTHTPLENPPPELEVETSETGRFYTTPEGNRYPSITTILSILSKDDIEKWKDRIGHEKADAICEHAADRGTDLHQCIEDYLANREVTFPPDKRSKVKIMFTRLKRNILSLIDNILAQEIPLYSDVLQVAGRCDCIAYYDGVLSIIDFKSTIKAKRKDWIQGYLIQATAYSVMLEERTGIVCKQIVIIISGEDDFSSQVFIDDRDNYIEQLNDVRQQFEDQGGQR